MPALFTSTSSFPYSESAVFTTRSQSVGWVTSRCT